MTDAKTTLPILPIMVLPKPVEGFRFDKTKDRWALVEDVALEGEPKLLLDTFLQEGESSVVGRTMLERAKEGAEKKGAPAGQLHAERMLEYQDEIPVEWQNYYLAFAGTVWRDLRGRLFVPYLYWGVGEWHLLWGYLGSGWRDGGRLVRLGK